MTSDDVIKYEGFWKIAGEDKEEFPGTLELSYNYIQLSCYDLPRELNNPNEIEEFELIHGFTKCGKKVTLLNSTLTNWTMHAPGMLEAVFKPDVAFVGWHFENKDDLQFYKLYIEYPNLQKWTGQSGLSFTISKKNVAIENIRVNLIPDIELGSLNQLIKYSIVTSYNFKREHAEKGFSLGFSENQSIKIQSIHNRNISFDDFVKFVFSYFSDFLRFATQQQMPPSSVIAYSWKAFSTPRKMNRKIFKKHKGNIREPIFIYYSHFRIREPEKDFDEKNILIPFNSIRDRLPEILSNWYRIVEDFDISYFTYMSTFFSEKKSLESQLISCIQMIEIFYNLKYLPEERKQRNDPKYDKRVKEKIKVIWEEKQDVFINYFKNENIYKKIRKIVKEDSWRIRHALVHCKKADRERIKQWENMFEAILLLRTLFEVLLINEIGFSNDEISSMLKNSQGINNRLNRFYRYR